MRSFFIIREVFADAVDHHHNEGAIIHVQPVRAADKFIGAVSRKWAVNILAQVWLVKTCHDIGSFAGLVRADCIKQTRGNSVMDWGLTEESYFKS